MLRISKETTLTVTFLLASTLASVGSGQGVAGAPDRGDQGDGPFDRLIIRGVTIIDGTGAPPVGPADIVIERNRIADIVSVGAPGVPIKEEGRPESATQELDATGMYILPGFVDYTIKDGIVYDAKELLADVARMVEKQKKARKSTEN